MYRKEYIIGVLSLIGSFLLGACYEDKGNYDYQELDKVVIDTTGLGIQPAYVLERYDVLELNPKVYFNGKLLETEADEPALSYVWTLYTGTTSGNSDFTVDTLSHTIHLNEAIKRAADSYYVQLTITNSRNNTQEYFRVLCNVEESITAGWMVLYEPTNDPGTSDVGLIVNPWVKKNIIKDREFFDLYKASNGASLEGLPNRVLHTCIALQEDEVVLVTDKNMVGVNQGAFAKTLDFGNFFYEKPATTKPFYYGAGGVGYRAEMIINDGKVYSTSFTSGLSRNNFFGVAYGGDHGELAAWGSDVHGNKYEVLGYDQTNERFTCVNKNTVKFTSFSAQDPAAAFDVNNVGAKLVMADWGRSYYDYMLMQKDQNYYLAIANFVTSNSGTTNIGQGWYDISTSPEIAQATSMAAAYLGEYVLYGAGSKVYNLKYRSSPQAEVLWSASAAETVTCVRLQKYYYQSLFLAMMPNPNAILHVATWNEASKEGKLYQFQINPANGAILGEPRVYTVPGKIKDMAWKKAMER